VHAPAYKLLRSEPMLGHRKPSSNKACCIVAVISSVQYVTLLCLQGYLRILKDLKQTQDRRHVLNQWYLKIKEVLQETQAICPEEKANYLDGAKECIEDLENNKYTVLIAGKSLNYRYSVLQSRLGCPVDSQGLRTILSVLRASIRAIRIGISREKRE